jgi:hypothetical protein
MQYVTLIAALALVFKPLQEPTPARGHFAPSAVPPIEAAERGFVSVSAYKFRDSKGKLWIAPKGTKTDCASIPSVCLPFTGDPCNEQYRSAALIHDAYCGKANVGQASYHQAPWPEVHRMFYEACLAGGTPDAKARLMYAAVYMFGPRNWTYQKRGGPQKSVQELFSSGELAMMKANTNSVSISDSLKQEQFKELAGFIEAKSPSLNELDKKMQSATKQLVQQKVLVLPGQYHKQ